MKIQSVRLIHSVFISGGETNSVDCNTNNCELTLKPEFNSIVLKQEYINYSGHSVVQVIMIPLTNVIYMTPAIETKPAKTKKDEV